MKYLYCDETWSKNHFTYDPQPMEFHAVALSSIFWRAFPTMLQLFGMFWTHNILRDIVRETNRYAIEVDGDGNCMGGEEWQEFTEKKTRAFMAIWLYIRMKRQPNILSYWHKRGFVFHCPTVSGIMTRRRLMLLTRCLHITNPITYVRDKNLPGYDKLGQVRWLIDSISENCTNLWTLGKFVTIDEMMIHYKGS